MKVVIDTNIIISAILKNRIPEKVILFVAEQDDFQWLVSSEILTEYKTVICRPKFKLPSDIIEKWLMVFDLRTMCINIDVNIDFSRDQKDAKFLACAIAGSANFLITGDKDFTEAQKILDTIIISVSEFNRLIIPNS
ncbi:MAG: putative toxin-antitoxin system toxin component, PIN family [Microcystaceae cyanobacterium]